MTIYKGIDIGDNNPEGDKRPLDSVGVYFKYLDVLGNNVLDN